MVLFLMLVILLVTIDFFHPSLSSNAIWQYDKTKKGYVIIAKEDIPQGAEVNVNTNTR